MNSSFSFLTTPQIQGNIPRSKFNHPHNVLLTGNVGQLIPFEVTEILPGDNLKRETNSLVRLQTLITPMMSDLYLDTWYFFVPSRLVWDHWQEFCGENKQSAWTPTTTYSVPQLNISGDKTVYQGSVADYMGIPYVENGISVNALPFRAYGLIYNEWFRDEAIQDPVLVPTGDQSYTMNSEIGWLGKPYLAGKFHDYFTSSLPQPQRGPDVSIPLAEGRLPVISSDEHGDMLGDADTKAIISAGLGSGYYNVAWNTAVDGSKTGRLKAKNTADVGSSYAEHFALSNLWADIGSGVPVATINTLRMAFATQHLYEIDSHGGRYVEILRNHFGVISPDARLQRPELISYNHFPLNIAQVVQTSETSSTPQGNTAAYSVTGDSSKSFDKSFVEHGYIIGIACVRYKNIYQQGLHRMWSRKTRFDYYWPVFANLGNQPVLNKEIYAQGTEEDDEVFGYQEAWAEYRYTPDRVAGEMRSSAAQSLDVWHLADYYDSLPILSPDWITVDGSTVNRVLAVGDSVSNQLLFDFNIDDVFTRPMPVHSVPGLNRM